MADHFTQFSCLLDVGTPENAARALYLYDRPSEEGASEEPPPKASSSRSNRSMAAANSGCAMT